MAKKACELQEQYGAEGQHPDFPRSEWEYDPTGASAHRGYWDWVAGRLSGDRCPHGLFYSGAGACPQCGRGAE